MAAAAEAEVAAVVVEAAVVAAPPEVVIVSDQPERLPMSAAASSTRYRFQVPFADRPSKTDRFTFPDGAGAGAGKTSVPGS